MPTRLPVLLYVFSVLFLPGKAHWGHSYTVESSPASCCSFWSGACCFSSHWPTGSCRLVSGMLHGFQLQSLLLSFVTEPFQAVLSPPCPGQHQRSPPCCPCSPGRDKEQRSERRVGESAVWAGLGVSVIALRTDEKVFVVKEASGEKESAAACSEREREPRHSGQTCPRGADVGAGACGGGCAASAGVCEGWPRGAGRLLWTAQLLYTLCSPPGCSGCVLFSAQVY